MQALRFSTHLTLYLQIRSDGFLILLQDSPSRALQRLNVLAESPV